MRITHHVWKSGDDEDVEFNASSMFINLLPGAINELIASVAQTHRLTKADRYGLLAAILDESITEDERYSIDRLIRSLVKGRIQIVDELSACM